MNESGFKASAGAWQEIPFLAESAKEKRNAALVDAAFSSRQTEKVVVTVPGLLHGDEEMEGGTPFHLEVTRVDSRQQGPQVEVTPDNETAKPKQPLVVNFTGVWGRAPEVEAEIKTMATAMGEDGLQMDLISLPGHGVSDDLPDGWDSDQAFDQTAKIMIAYLEQRKKELPDTPILLNAWSMGGVTALKIAAMRPDLIDGIVLIDTPVFRRQAYAAMVRFMLYPVHGALRPGKRVHLEEKMELESELAGLSVFKKRIAERNTDQGMPLGDVVLASAKQLCRQDLAKDGTLREVAHSGIPTLLLYGNNDFVVQRQLIKRLRNNMRAASQGNITTAEIHGAGHAAPDERPRAVGNAIKNWLEEEFRIGQNRKQRAAEMAEFDTAVAAEISSYRPAPPEPEKNVPSSAGL